MDGNAPNMFHGNDAYFRYDGTGGGPPQHPPPPSARPMGPPPGAYARHRGPHPGMQQQPQGQYPGYQSAVSTDNMYGMATDPQAAMAGMNDMSAWGGAAAQGSPYGAPGMAAYNHPQMQQHQRQPQAGYRQHMSGYPQQDPKMQYPVQQNVMGGMLPGQGGYGPASVAAQQQQNPTVQAQRVGVPPHYPQSHGGMYPGAQAQASVAQSPYGAAAGYHPQHQPVSRAPPHHIGYGHAPMEQAYGQQQQHHHQQQQQQQQPQQQSANNHMQQQQQAQQAQHNQSHVPTPQVHGLGAMQHSAAQQQHLVGHHGALQQSMHGNVVQPGVVPQQQQQPPHSAAAYSHMGAGGYGVVPPVVSQQPQAQQSPVSQQQQQQQQPQQQQQSVMQSQQPYLPTGKPLAAASTSSPQYRAPFPQLSPQMSSPRPPQISPHPQMSPRPVMSPAKPPPPQQQQSLSPHPHIPGVASPRPGGPQAQQPPSGGKNNSPVTTLQALEQMVMPGATPTGGPMPMNPMEYSQGGGVAASGGYRQHPGVMSNPLSPMGPRMPMSPQQQQQWVPPPNSHPMAVQQQHRQGSHSNMYPIPPQQQQQPMPPQSIQHVSQQQAQQPITSQHMMTDLGVMGMNMGGYGGVGVSTSQQDQSLGMSQMPQVATAHQQQPQAPPVLQHSIDNQLNTPHQIAAQQQQQQSSHGGDHQMGVVTQHLQNSMTMPVGQGVMQHQQHQEKGMNSQGDPMNSMNQMTQQHHQVQQPPTDHLLMDPFATMDPAGNVDQAQNNSSAAVVGGATTTTSGGHPQISMESALGLDGLQQQQQQDNSQMMKESVPQEKASNDQSMGLVGGNDENQLLSDVYKEKDYVGAGDEQNSLQNNASLMDGTGEMQHQQQTSYDSQSDNSQSSLHQQQQQQQITTQNQMDHQMQTIPGQTEITSTDQKMLDVGQTTIDGVGIMQPPQPASTDPTVMAVPPQPPVTTDNMVGGYGMPTPTPLLHHQERGMIQQQLQELYCLLPGPETQEKIHRLQERMNVLQQHEINEQCNGGSHCSLQPQVYVPPMIDSPQVSSTTGRGRGRGVSKPRKPRQKKGEKQFQGDASESSPIESSTPYSTNSSLPVSEDCVTPGAGLTDIPAEMADANGSDEDGENSQDKSVGDGEVSEKGGKKRKSKKAAKEGKTPKEKKKREAKKSGSKKKKGRKSDESELDSTIDASMDTSKVNDDLEGVGIPDGNEQAEEGQIEVATASASGVATTTAEGGEVEEGKLSEEITDFDDIPVSKISIKADENTENSDAPKADEADDSGSTPSAKKKRSGGGSSRSSASRRSRPSSGRKPPSSKSKSRRSRMITESDGEGEDMLATPPASPTDGDLDSSKRRSARNTQRKKYIDDVMLRFSDDDNELTSPSTSKKDRKTSAGTSAAASTAAAAVLGQAGDVEGGTAVVVTTTEAGVEIKDVEPVAEDFGGKPNYVYVNTTDEDSMVVQLILAVRIGKRELKPEPPRVPTPVVVEPPDVKSEEMEVKKEGEEETNTTIEHNVDGEEDEKKQKDETATESGAATDSEEKKLERKEGESPDVEKKDTVPTKESDERTDEEGKLEEEEEKINEETEAVDKPNSPVSAVSPVEGKSEAMETDESESKLAAATPVELEEEKKDKDEKEEEEKEPKEDTPNEDVTEEEKQLSESVEPMDTTDTDETKQPEEDFSAKPKESEDAKAPVAEDATKPVVDEEKPSETVEVKTEPVDVAADKEENKPEPVFVEVEEYFVKYRNFSYLHCEWRTEEELTKGDRRVAAKIKRFLQKQQSQINIFENIEDEPFNPDFTEVDRVLDMSEHKDAVTGDTTKHYLVKWKSLPYEDCTWELEEDVDQIKIAQFERFTKLPPRNEWKSKKRPHPDQWKKLEKTPIYKAGNSLRPYQLEGLNWLKFSWFNSHNCILADEMGLGKTIQSLTFVHSIWEWGIRGPFLVIAPLSTIPNWQREFEGWTDMNVIVYHGSQTSKQMLQEYEFYYKNDNGKVIKDLTKFNVLITTFEMIVTDYADLKQFNWRACVIDEAHRLKNRNCKLLEGLRQLNLEHRVLLSGTPLQNNVSELFSLLNFLEPNQFGSSEEFTKEFGSLKTESEVQKLQALLKPMMLRRLKDDVEKSLAPKEETLVEVELTNIQKKYYRGILEQNFSFLSRGTSAANIPNLMNTMMELRKCCIHPYLLNGAEENIQYDHNMQFGVDPDAYYKNLVNSSGKMVLLDKLLPKLKANGHRVLIFSQMVRCLDLLEDYLMYKKYTFERIDGRIRGDLRQAAIDRYSKPDSDRFVFLLCTKAGGLGINLTAADTVIIYDSDWNPQNDLQAQARCHRIGQQKMVKIYRLLCRNTYEREMFDKASLKLGLDKAILQSMNTTQGKETNAKQMSKKEIEDLLKKGAYGAIMDEDAGDKFCEEDIDSILQRRTQVITMESEKGSTFSKASFAMSGNRSDINIDDPDFWKKWAKRADIDPTVADRDEKEDLVLLEPRRRTQIKRFGHDEGVGVDISEDSLSDSAEEGVGVGARMKRRRERREKKRRVDDKEQEEYVPREPGMGNLMPVEEVAYGNWNRTECFKVEKGLLSFGWGRWPEILEQGAFKKTWRDLDVEELARIILLYCLRCYKGDEKIKNFIWDLIAPVTEGEDAASFRNHSGLHNLVPRGRNAKGRQGNKVGKEQAGSSTNSNASSPRDKQAAAAAGVKEMDPNHWSNDDKYDCEVILDSSYKKHLARHANKVLLRVRMLFYIKHEIIGDYVEQIAQGVNVRNFGDPMVLSYINKSLLRDLPIRPPLTSEQMPSTWWIPNCCDKSLLVGTYKHGCENYQEIRSDSTLCFITHIGLPPEDGGGAATTTGSGGTVGVFANKAEPVTPAPVTTNMEEDTKMDDIEEIVDEDGKLAEPKASTSTADKGESDRPASSGLEDDDVIITGTVPASGGDDLTWPSMQDLNTRLRRVITSYQRNYKKEEQKAAQQQKQAKIQASMASASPLVVPSGSSSASSTPTPSASTPTTTSANQSQQQPQQSQPAQAGNTSKQANNNPLASQPGMSSAVDMLLSLGFGINPNDPTQLANIDINKLAMYLQKFGSKEQLEKQMRERERMRLQQSTKKWSRKDENEFLRVLTCYGIDLIGNTNALIPNWTKFKQMARLERKSDDSMSDYYKVFIAMCKRQAGVKLLEDEKGLENLIDDISEDHARLILDRLELLSKLREVVKSNKLEDRLKLSKNNYDTPDWWEPGKHDLELIKAILKHGLHKSEDHIMNDPTFSFRVACAEFEDNIKVYNQNAMLKLEEELHKMKAATEAAAVAADEAETAAAVEKADEKESEEATITEAVEGEEEKAVEEATEKVPAEVIKSESPEPEEVINKEEEVKEPEAEESHPPVDDKPDDEEPVDIVKEPTIETTEVTEEEKMDEVEKPKSPQSPEKDVEEAMEATEESAEPKETTQPEEVKSPVADTPADKVDEAKEQEKAEETEIVPEPVESKEVESAEKDEIMECDDAEPKLSTDEEFNDVDEEEKPEEVKEASPAPVSPERDEVRTNEEVAEVTEKPMEKETEVPEAAPAETIEEVTEESPAQETPAIEKMETGGEEENEEKDVETEKVTESSTSPDDEKEPESTTIDVVAEKEENPVEEHATHIEPAAAAPVKPLLTVALPKIDLMTDLKMVEEDCKMRAEELKARFPDLEVIQPAKSGDDIVVEVKPVLPKLMEKQLLIRWFRDFALEKRVSHIIYCVEKNDWPVGKSYSAYTGCQGMDLDVPLFETIKRIPVTEVVLAPVASSSVSTAVNPDIITINTDQGLSKQLGNSLLQSLQSALGGVPPGGVTLTPMQQHQMGQASGGAQQTGSGKSGGGGGGKGRKRHIAIDVETERAKLHALLNNTQSNQSSTKWLEDELKGSDSRRGSSGGGASSLQPPPAHQPVSRSAMNAAANYNKTTVIPGTSSTLTPIDLSSSFPKVNMAAMMKSPIDLSEVQDFSISSKLKSGHGGGGGQQNVFGMQMTAAQGGAGSGKGSKLDSMLSKLMKKNNVPVPVEEAPLGKANKKRKLDEIVMGLSSAQEQKMYPDPMLTPSSHRKTQITPSVSVTPANATATSAASNQKPFTITVTSVPASGQGGSSSSKQQQQQQQQQSQKHNPLSSASGLAALQNMAGLSGASSKELNAYLAEAAKAEQMALLKQHQKLLQQLPANSPHRKAYEAMYNEMKQMADLSQLYNQKLGNYSGHDAKVNKWLAEHQQSMESIAQPQPQPTTSDYGGRGGRGQRSTRQSQQQPTTQNVNQIQQKQDAVLSRFSLTGEETVPVIHKISGKRLSGNKAPQLKRITQWLAENPAYEIDPKWLELAQMPMTAPSPKPSPSAESTSSSSSAKAHQQQQQQQGRAASNNAAAMAQMANQYQQSAAAASSSVAASKKQRASEVAALNAALQFPGLQGLNPQLLSQLGVNFDPKNPLSMLPFAGMAPGLGNLGNLNNMNLLANLAGLSGLGNMDAQTLATMMAASGLDANTLAALTSSMSGQLAGQQQQQQGSSSASSGRQSSGNKGNTSGGGNMSGGRGSKGGKSDSASSQSSQGGSGSSGKGGQGNNSNFPFPFANPSMMYPLGLNPYALNPNMSPYDQLAQYSLLNGSLGGSASSSSASPRQGSSQSGKSQSSSGGRGQQSSSSGSSFQGGSGPSGSGSSKGQSRSSAAATAAALSSGQMSRADLNHLQSLLPHDPMLLESLTRVAAGLDITRSSGGGGSGNAEKKSRESASSSAAAKEVERRKQAESMSRSSASNFPMDMAMIQALAQGKMPPSLAKASAKDLQMLAQLPPELSQAFLLEMAQAAGVNLGGLPGMGLGGGGGGQSSSSSSSSSQAAAMKRAREQDLRDLENLNKAQMEMLARNLGMSSSISLIPTSGGSSGGHGGEEKAKRSRTSDQGSSSRSSSSSSQLKQQTDEAAAAFAMAMAEAKMRSAMQQSMSGMGGGGGGERSSSSSRERERERDRDREHQRKSSDSKERGGGGDRHESSAAAASSSTSSSSSSVMNLSSLPSQTTITLASPGSSSMKMPHATQESHSERSGGDRDRERERERERSRERERERGGGEGSSSSASKSYKDRSDYDLEDLIAPSKVNKSGSMAHEEEESEEAHHARKEDEDNGGGERRRTRGGKRPRSGDDMDAIMGLGGQPERKRELRSSAGRAAAAAAARIAAEAKAAAAAAVANTSGGSEHQMSEEERDHART